MVATDASVPQVITLVQMTKPALRVKKELGATIVPTFVPVTMTTQSRVIPLPVIVPVCPAGKDWIVQMTSMNVKIIQ